jgi:hypothetical protein
MDDGASDQLRKKRHEQAILQEAVFACPAGAGIDQVGDLLERVEGNRQRQDDGFEMKIRARDIIGGFRQEIGVFVIADQRQVEDNAGIENVFPGSARVAVDRTAQQEIDADGGDQQDQVGRVPPALEEQRTQGQPGQRCIKGRMPAQVPRT